MTENDSVAEHTDFKFDAVTRPARWLYHVLDFRCSTVAAATATQSSFVRLISIVWQKTLNSSNEKLIVLSYRQDSGFGKDCSLDT